MCGLFGIISPNWNQNILRTLAVCNRERGTDSLGFFDSSGRMKKGAADPARVLGQENITKWLEESSKGSKKRVASWFVAGHTRQGTRGKANRRNAHPFRYGNIIASHNGMVDAPKDYEVDSQYLVDTLQQTGGNYQEAWKDISGYWVMTWFDGHALYLQSHSGELHITYKDGVWYYSSDDEHLEAALGQCDNMYKFQEGETWKFTYTDGKIEYVKLENFVSEAPKYYKYTYTQYKYTDESETSYYGDKLYANTKSTTSDSAVDSNARDWDEEWKEAWAEYSLQSEHSQP